jgi:hypothetical protein
LPYRSATVTADWEHAVAEWSEQALIAPRSGDEDQADGRQAVVELLELFMTPGADIAAHDRVVVRGDLFEVDGPPSRWGRQSGEAGVVVRARRVTG